MSNLPLFTPKNSMGLTVSKLIIVSVKIGSFKVFNQLFGSGAFLKYNLINHQLPNLTYQQIVDIDAAPVPSISYNPCNTFFFPNFPSHTCPGRGSNPDVLPLILKRNNSSIATLFAFYPAVALLI